MKSLALSILAVGLACCSNTASSTDNSSEFVASAADFSNYTSWTQNGAPRHGVDPSGLLGGGAHGADDTDVIRTIWMKQSNPQRDANNQFPVGTIFAKESSMGGQVQMVTAMVKRGGNYNTSGNGWEYFMLSGGQIMGRGDTLMSSMCMGCHSGAGASRDFVFTR